LIDFYPTWIFSHHRHHHHHHHHPANERVSLRTQQQQQQKWKRYFLVKETSWYLFVKVRIPRFKGANSWNTRENIMRWSELEVKSVSLKLKARSRLAQGVEVTDANNWERLGKELELARSSSGWCSFSRPPSEI
jgi:hypothetical protein